MEHSCPRCGVEMEAGAATAHGLMGWSTRQAADPTLVFVVLGTPTSPNPITAFKQGASGEPGDRAYLLRGYRCPHCCVVELYARDATTV